VAKPVAGTLTVRKNKHLLLWSSVGTLALLVGVAVEQNYLQDWQLAQAAVAERLAPEPFEVELRQVVVPELGLADRCVSCHVGMAAGVTGIEGDRIYGAHPKVGHDPAKFGCTVCHGGQGRATSQSDAHGNVPHWPAPMIPRRRAQAGCGSCHAQVAVPSQPVLERGRAAFERNDCLSCHRIDGRGGTLRPSGSGGLEGPDLSRVGAAGYRDDWHEQHVEQHEQASSGPWMHAFRPVLAAERTLIEGYLATRSGAPDLVEAKALFHSLGCRGCHRAGGLGGDDGPDLARVGNKDPGQTSFAGVRGPPTLATWFGEHLQDPARVTAGSQMPALHLDAAQIDGLVLYLLSLRRSPVPEAYWPRDRMLAERFGRHEFATDAVTLYGALCGACHGPRGAGLRYPGTEPFPAVANPDFLTVADDRFIAATIREGRPGRRMPAWGSADGGLTDEHIDRLVAHLRELGGGEAYWSDGRARRWIDGDAKAGAELFAEQCASCHGSAGEGDEAPALANPKLLTHGSDTFFVETISRGRRGTTMEGFARGSLARRSLSNDEIEAIVAYIRTWEKQP